MIWLLLVSAYATAKRPPYVFASLSTRYHLIKYVLYNIRLSPRVLETVGDKRYISQRRLSLSLILLHNITFPINYMNGRGGRGRGEG